EAVRAWQMRGKVVVAVEQGPANDDGVTAIGRVDRYGSCCQATGTVGESRRDRLPDREGRWGTGRRGSVTPLAVGPPAGLPSFRAGLAGPAGRPAALAAHRWGSPGRLFRGIAGPAPPPAVQGPLPCRHFRGAVARGRDSCVRVAAA